MRDQADEGLAVVSFDYVSPEIPSSGAGLCGDGPRTKPDLSPATQHASSSSVIACPVSLPFLHSCRAPCSACFAPSATTSPRDPHRDDTPRPKPRSQHLDRADYPSDPAGYHRLRIMGRDEESLQYVM
jgi:hypothetical protein